MRRDARLAALERRLGGREDERPLRTVIIYDDDPAPQAGPDEQLLIVRVIHTRDAEHTPPAMSPTNGQAKTAAELEAEVKALERERDDLKAKGKNARR